MICILCSVDQVLGCDGRNNPLLSMLLGTVLDRYTVLRKILLGGLHRHLRDNR